MEDIGDVRRLSGTAADFSGWAMGTEGFEHMNITTKEQVVEPEVEQKKPENVIRKEQKQKEEVEKKELPNSPKELTVNPLELKSIAIRFIPTVDKITSDKYNEICDEAIELAFAFETVWQKKIQIGE